MITTAESTNNKAVSSERGDAFDFTVTVLMLGIGRLAGNAHGKIGQQRR